MPSYVRTWWLYLRTQQRAIEMLCEPMVLPRRRAAEVIERQSKPPINICLPRMLPIAELSLLVKRKAREVRPFSDPQRLVGGDSMTSWLILPA
jgi:hypothetical protein